MKYIVIGNWKMNPASPVEAKKLLESNTKLSQKFKNIDLVVAIPFVYLSLFKTKAKRFFLGAQDTFIDDTGPFTGEVGAIMLKNMGAKFVIVGHSERRAMGETNQIVNKKLRAVLKAKLVPVVCVGEKEHDHHGNYLSFLREQVQECLAGLSRSEAAKIIIAYEPVWAVGVFAKGAMDSRMLHETVLFIQKVLIETYGRKNFTLPKILYGGSVDGKNAGDLIEHGNVGGFLVGRACLTTEMFEPILRAVNTV